MSRSGDHDAASDEKALPGQSLAIAVSKTQPQAVMSPLPMQVFAKFDSLSDLFNHVERELGKGTTHSYYC